MQSVSSTRESLNFQVAAKERQCFFENIEGSSPSRVIDVFVHSGGNIEVIHSIHGPLEYKDIIHVRSICLYGMKEKQ